MWTEKQQTRQNAKFMISLIGRRGFVSPLYYFVFSISPLLRTRRTTQRPKTKPHLLCAFPTPSRLRKIQFLEFMADVISKGSVFTPCRCRCSSGSSKRTKPLSTNLFRSSIRSKNGLLGRRLVVERQKGKVLNRDLYALPVKVCSKSSKILCFGCIIIVGGPFFVFRD